MFALRPAAITGVALLGFLVRVDSAAAFLAYVSNEKGNSISVVDTDKMETVATIKTGQRPRGIEVTRDGKFVFVALGDDDKIEMFDTRNDNDAMVTIIDMEKRTAVGQVSVGTEPEGMAVSPDSKTLVCTSETTSMVHFIDTTSREVLASVLVGSRPRFSAFKSDGSE